jgi:hypothetical protein
MPRFYEELAGREDIRAIVEAPAPEVLGLFVDRSHFLRHRKRTLLGYWGEPPGHVQGHPFVSLEQPGLGCASSADALVVHRDLAAEKTAYFRFVYSTGWQAWGDPADLRLMTALRQGFTGAPRLPGSLETRLRRELGSPAYEDEHIAAWELACEAPGG